MNRQEKFILYPSLILILISVFFYLLLPFLFNVRESGDFIGLVSEAKGETKLRLGKTISWMRLQKLSEIYSRSYLFTGANSSLTILFLDESFLKLRANSLIYLDYDLKHKEKKSKGLVLDFVDGEMAVDLKKNSSLKKIKIKDTEIEIMDSEAKIVMSRGFQNKEMALTVLEGDINIKTQGNNLNLRTGQSLKISNKEHRKEEVSKELLDEMKRVLSKNNKRAELPEYFKDRSLKNFFIEIARIFVI